MFSDDMKEEIISGWVEILMSKLDQIILFGSVVRGDAKEDSDIDIAIILQNDMENEERNRFIHWNAQKLNEL